MPTLSAYYTINEIKFVDPTLKSKDASAPFTADLNGDGHMDLVILGAYYPGGSTNYSPQEGRVLLGDGLGNFTPSSATTFPTSTLLSVHPRKTLFADFNGDGRTDMFVADHGWDANPFPGAQNRLYLSTAAGGLEDATARLPQLSDFSHSAASGDIDGDGDIDIFVGNGYGSQGMPLSYMLLNDGKGNFSQTRDIIPAQSGGVLDFTGASPHHFPGSSLADLNGDGLPELLIAAEAGSPFDALRNSVVLWNQGGKFSENAMSLLPAPAGMTTHIDLDIQRIDFNSDGRQDLVVIGTNPNPYYDGAFVQLLRNDGNNAFTDVTATSMAAEDARTSIPGTSTGNPWAMWVNVLDFNNDGVMDFSVEYSGNGLKASTPLVWLNNGSGQFTTLKVSDFVNTGDEWRIGYGHFYKTENGYSIAAVQYSGGSGLLVGGLVSTKPYREHIAQNFAGGDLDDQISTTAVDNTINGGAGVDTVVAAGARVAYSITKTSGGYQLRDKQGNDGLDTLTNVEMIRFTDMTVDLTIGANAATISPSNLKTLEELYVAFFNRVPDASGLNYWITQYKNGQSISSIAESFYSAAVQYSSLTGYSSTMTNADFVKVIYKNVLGRTGASAPPDADVNYWAGELAKGNETKGSLVTTMLGSAHTFKGNATWGWVADLLDNKATVANYVAVQQGITYNSAEDSISKGSAVAAAVTATDTDQAIGLVGITDSGFSLA
jgi:hypothetical protein